MSRDFELVSNYQPAGDQPTAIAKLMEGLESGLAHQTLLGAVSYTHLTLPTILLV